MMKILIAFISPFVLFYFFGISFDFLVDLKVPDMNPYDWPYEIRKGFFFFSMAFGSLFALVLLYQKIEEYL